MSRAVSFSEAENLADARRMAEMLHALNTLPFPLVGRVQGAALGGGAGLAAVCDLVVASETAFFGFTEVKLGILPAVIAPYVIAKIGQSFARELFLTGARFTARRAEAIGLVHRVVAESELDPTIESCLAELATSSPTGIAAAKVLIADVVGRPPAETRELTTIAIARQRVSVDGQEGMKAFLERRTARWGDRR
jgi:methylglutaconyl-CoA hydratase